MTGAVTSQRRPFIDGLPGLLAQLHARHDLPMRCIPDILDECTSMLERLARVREIVDALDPDVDEGILAALYSPLVKPPLGVLPEPQWIELHPRPNVEQLERRVWALETVIKRYRERDVATPPEWADELSRRRREAVVAALRALPDAELDRTMAEAQRCCAVCGSNLREGCQCAGPPVGNGDY